MYQRNPHPCANSLSARVSAAQQDNYVDEKQADEDEGEVDEELLQVPLGLRVHLDLRRSADGRFGHVLDALHGGLSAGAGYSLMGWIWEVREFSQAAGGPVGAEQVVMRR